MPITARDLAFDWRELTLAGTLFLPHGDGPYPAVVMVQGSGPTDRDSGEYFPQATLDPATEQEAFTKLNARIALMPIDGNWEIALLGRNLTDKTVTGYAADIPLAARTFGAPSYGSFVAPPRSVALQATMKF